VGESSGGWGRLDRLSSHAQTFFPCIGFSGEAVFDPVGMERLLARCFEFPAQRQLRCSCAQHGRWWGEPGATRP